MTKNGIKTTSENNTLSPMTPGQQLRQAREAKNLTQDAIAKQLFINKQVIVDLEEDNYSNIVATAYARGYLLSYARLLQINPQSLLTEFEKLIAPTKSNQPQIKILQEISINTNADHQRHWLSYIAAIIIIIALVLWGYNHYQQIAANKVLEKSTATAIVVPETNAADKDNKTTTTIISMPKAASTQDTQNFTDEQ